MQVIADEAALNESALCIPLREMPRPAKHVRLEVDMTCIPMCADNESFLSATAEKIRNRE